MRPITKISRNPELNTFVRSTLLPNSLMIFQEKLKNTPKQNTPSGNLKKRLKISKASLTRKLVIKKLLLKKKILFTKS